MHGRRARAAAMAAVWQPHALRNVCDYSAARPHCVSSDARERSELGLSDSSASSRIRRTGNPVTGPKISDPHPPAEAADNAAPSIKQPRGTLSSNEFADLFSSGKPSETESVETASRRFKFTNQGLSIG